MDIWVSVCSFDKEKLTTFLCILRKLSFSDAIQEFIGLLLRKWAMSPLLRSSQI